MLNGGVFVFPGQGTQTVGMGADLAENFAEARYVFEEIDDTLNQKLSQLMFTGDLSELTKTENAQPAIMAVSMAVWRILEKNGIQAAAMAGHSLGEYSALCAAKVLSLADTTKLLRARGLAMSKACKKEYGGMLALLGATPEQAKEIAVTTDSYVANDNAPGQIVLSGTLTSLDKSKEMAEKMSIKRVVFLQVAGAFHSPLMQSAADEMAPVLEQTTFHAAQIPVFFNVTACAESDERKYADLLTKQIVSPVRWRELIQNTGAKHFVECGVGNVLSGLIKRIVPGCEIECVGTSEDVQKL